MFAEFGDTCQFGVQLGVHLIAKWRARLQGSETFVSLILTKMKVVGILHRDWTVAMMMVLVRPPSDSWRSLIRLSLMLIPVLAPADYS